MSRQNLNVDGKIGGRKGKVRKRGCSSSSSSSLAQNYRLKRSILVGKRGGSTTPVPMWKMMSSESQSLEKDKAFKYLAGKNGGNAKELSVSARKLAAILWEINGMPSPRVKMEILEDKMSEVGMARKERILVSSKLSSMELGLSDPFHITNSEVGLHFFLCLDTRIESADCIKVFIYFFVSFESCREWIHLNCAVLEEEHWLVLKNFCRLVVI